MPKTTQLGMFNIPNYAAGAPGGLMSAGLGGSSGSLLSTPTLQPASPTREIGAPGIGLPQINRGPLQDPCLQSLATSGQPTPCPPNQSHQPAPCGPCTAIGTPGPLSTLPTQAIGAPATLGLVGGTQPGLTSPAVIGPAGTTTTSGTVDPGLTQEIPPDQPATCDTPTSPNPGKPGQYSWNTRTCTWELVDVAIQPISAPVTSEKRIARDIRTGQQQVGGQRGAISRQELGQFFGRTGGGIGGGAQTGLEVFQNPLLAAGSPYIGKNVSQFDEGGRLANLANLGRGGDTELAHVNPQEKAMLKAMGGSGTTNPYTGLKEYGWFGDFLGDLVSTVTTPFKAIGDVVKGDFTWKGSVLDPLLPDAFDPWIWRDEGQPTKSAVFNPETGGYEIQTNQPGTTLGFDPTGQTLGTAAPHITTPSGTGNILAQATEGDPWKNYPSTYSPPILRGVAGRKPKDKVNVVNPFQSDFKGAKGEDQASALGLEDYRWDLENPYIRENVDIFNKGGKMKNRYSYPGGGRADFAIGLKRGLNSALAAGQIEQVIKNNRSTRRFTSGGKF